MPVLHLSFRNIDKAMVSLPELPAKAGILTDSPRFIQPSNFEVRILAHQHVAGWNIEIGVRSVAGERYLPHVQRRLGVLVAIQPALQEV